MLDAAGGIWRESPGARQRVDAVPILERHEDAVCTFNDDLLGTSAVTLAGIFRRPGSTGHKLTDRRFVFLERSQWPKGHFACNVVADAGEVLLNLDRPRQCGANMRQDILGSNMLQEVGAGHQPRWLISGAAEQKNSPGLA